MKGRHFLFFCLIISGSAFSQKIKYKDLFVLLNAKQYDQAEPFLRKYLKDIDDNPNAHLFMGLILQDKAVKKDILKETEQVKIMADSATLYLNLAYKGITEKELKRNDEYYQAYARRDLRTGEFGVSMSDVRLDIEKRVQSLKERSDKVLSAKTQFILTERYYQTSEARYKELQAAFAAERELLLRSDDAVLAKLALVASAYDSAMAAFNAYKATLSSLGKTGYNQTLHVREIKEFHTDGGGQANFYVETVQVWDYAKWASGSIDIIRKEVEPFRTKLVSYDIEINKLRDKVRKDSVEVTKEIAGIQDKLKDNSVARFDPAPMPLQLFQMKLAELTYASNHIINKKARDSSDIVLRMAALKADVRDVKRVDSIAMNLEQSALDEEALNYQHFITNAYGTTLVLKSLVKATREFADHELRRKEASFARALRAMDWLLVDQDSVPLTMIRSRKYTHSPLVIQSETFTSGLKYGADSVANGYFYTITRTRVPDVKVTFAVDKTNFQRRNLPVIKGLGSKDANGQVYFAAIYSETKTDNKFPVTIAKIYRTDGLAWSSNYKFEFPPSELIFSADTGELSVKIASPSGESKVIVLDKNGKQL